MPTRYLITIWYSKSIDRFIKYNLWTNKQTIVEEMILKMSPVIAAMFGRKAGNIKMADNNPVSAQKLTNHDPGYED